jgi:hypothetical protein
MLLGKPALLLTHRQLTLNQIDLIPGQPAFALSQSALILIQNTLTFRKSALTDGQLEEI